MVALPKAQDLDLGQDLDQGRDLDRDRDRDRDRDQEAMMYCQNANYKKISSLKDF